VRLPTEAAPVDEAAIQEASRAQPEQEEANFHLRPRRRRRPRPESAGSEAGSETDAAASGDLPVGE